MDIFIRNQLYRGPLRGVVLDWAGTCVDFGCMGPVAVFVKAFEQFAVRVSVTEARQFMGREKKEHIRRMCRLPAIMERWEQVHGNPPAEGDVDALYAETEPMMVQAVSEHCELIPGLLEVVRQVRERGGRIGTSTGYTAPMMDVLLPKVREQGFVPDAVVCSSDVPAGRPFPWMCLLNAIRLQVYPLEALVKVGDTLSDIEAGLNAGMWTVGLTRSGNEMGMTKEETEALDPQDLDSRLKAVQNRFYESGAHYVVEGIWDLLPVLEAIEKRLSRGERP